MLLGRYQIVLKLEMLEETEVPYFFFFFCYWFNALMAFNEEEYTKPAPMKQKTIYSSFQSWNNYFLESSRKMSFSYYIVFLLKS